MKEQVQLGAILRRGDLPPPLHPRFLRLCNHSGWVDSRELACGGSQRTALHVSLNLRPALNPGASLLQGAIHPSSPGTLRGSFLFLVESTDAGCKGITEVLGLEVAQVLEPRKTASEADRLLKNFVMKAFATWGTAEGAQCGVEVDKDGSSPWMGYCGGPCSSERGHEAAKSQSADTAINGEEVRAKAKPYPGLPNKGPPRKVGGARPRAIGRR